MASETHSAKGEDHCHRHPITLYHSNSESLLDQEGGAKALMVVNPNNPPGGNKPKSGAKKGSSKAAHKHSRPKKTAAAKVSSEWFACRWHRPAHVCRAPLLVAVRPFWF